jgi:hypothetical protein
VEPLDDDRRRHGVRWSRRIFGQSKRWRNPAMQVHEPFLLLHHVLHARHHLAGLLLYVLWLRSRRRSAGVEWCRSSGRPKGVLVDFLQKEVIANFKKVQERARSAG